MFYESKMYLFNLQTRKYTTIKIFKSYCSYGTVILSYESAITERESAPYRLC